MTQSGRIFFALVLLLFPETVLPQFATEQPDADEPGVIPLQPMPPLHSPAVPDPFPVVPPSAPEFPSFEQPDRMPPAGWAPAPAPPPLRKASADDMARFLAGLPLDPAAPLATLESWPGWRSHRSGLDDGWRRADTMRLGRMTEWARTSIHPQIRRPRQIFYLFGGPDFLSVVTLFREVPSYVLVGMEPLGNVPDPLAMPLDQLNLSLANLRHSLRSLLEKSFFETLEMREDLQRGGIDGVLPLLLIFAARTGHEVLDYQYVVLDAKGSPSALPDGMRAGAIGVVLGIRVSPQSPRQEVYYFQSDLSDAGIGRDDRLLQFLESRGGGGSYLKAASYLMHGAGFDRVRGFLLNDSTFILQDASGIPFRFFPIPEWHIDLFGSYVGPVNIFEKFFQPDLRLAFTDPARVRPLPFGTGYRRDDSETHQIFAIRASGRVVPVLPDPSSPFPGFPPSVVEPLFP